jgi:hypothetical protein
MNYQAKIDIKKLNKAFVMPIQGKTATVECVCIPTSEFYKGKNGELYCSMQIQERKSVGQFGDTHYLKQQLEKESYKALTEEQRKAIPILGSFEPSKFTNVETVVAEEVKPQTANTSTKVDDGMPF